MANWTDIDTNSLLPGEPITSALMLALEENPRALAEQASGATKIADKTIFVSGSGTVTTSGFDDFGGVWIDATYEYISGGGQSLQVSFSDDGSTFYGATTIITVNSTDSPAMVRAFFDFATGDFKRVGMIVGSGSVSGSGTVAGLSLDVTHVRLKFAATSGATGAAILQPQGGESAS